jgi:hypothetical protein
MAKYFRIAIQRSSDTLHLKLIGEFDGRSAHELLNTIQKNRNGASRIFIHTSSLKRTTLLDAIYFSVILTPCRKIYRVWVNRGQSGTVGFGARRN